MSSRVTEKSLCSIFSMLGTISLTANSSAVWPMSWCCSEKSSGVNTSLGWRSSKRKLPPEIFGFAAETVAMRLIVRRGELKISGEHRTQYLRKPLFIYHHCRSRPAEWPSLPQIGRLTRSEERRVGKE